jgi:hypothetical protein
VLHEPRFVDLAPAEVYATLLDNLLVESRTRALACRTGGAYCDPFPPLALSSFLGTMGTSDACRADPLKGRAPGRPGHATGLPCCQSPRAYVLRPLPRRAERSSRVGVSDRPQRPSSNERRLGARIQAFGACSEASLVVKPPSRAALRKC